MAKQADIRKGQCLCGAVSFAAALPDSIVQMCHCIQCQRWTGGGPLATVRVKQVEMRGEDAINSYQASDHGERAFCGTCGTTLYWRLQGRAIVFMPVGLFDDQSGLTVGEEIFVDHRPDWLHAWPNANQHSEVEMQAQLQEYLEANPK